MRIFLSRLSIVLYISFIPLLNILGMAVPVLFLYIESVSIVILDKLFHDKKRGNLKEIDQFSIITQSTLAVFFFYWKDIIYIYGQLFVFFGYIALDAIVFLFRRIIAYKIERQRKLEVENSSCAYGIILNGSNTDIKYSLVICSEADLPSNIDLKLYFLRYPLSLGKSLSQNIIGENNKIHSLIISNHIEIIENYAFVGCPLLRYIFLPRSLNKIGEFVFAPECQLKKIFVPQWSKYQFVKWFPQHCHLIEEIKENKYWIKTKKKEGRLTICVNGITFDMLYVKKGDFLMGKKPYMNIPGESRYLNTHKISLTRNYYLGETQVTSALYRCVMGEDYEATDKTKVPITSITYDQCIEFIFRLNILTKLNFRLPTEAEWEYAARGGNKSRGFIYSGSNIIDDIAYYKDNSNCRVHPVKEKKPNELGLYDMSGNVFEMCMDKPINYMDIGEECFIDPILEHPDTDDEYESRIIRGGGWDSWEGLCRINSLASFHGDNHASSDCGFRLALDDILVTK